jgi:hypothetical protein
MLKASAYCACTITVLFFVFGFLRNPSIVSITFDLIAGIAIGSVFIWVLSFIFCFVLLIPLLPVFDRSSLMFSFLLFAIIGFYIPAWIGYWSSTIGAHGEIPDLYKENNINALVTIVTSGLLGMLGSLSAWYSLKQGKGVKYA